MSYILNVNCSTWLKESNGLFDYFTDETINSSLSLDSSGSIFIDYEFSLLFKRSGYLKPYNSIYLNGVIRDENQYKIQMNGKDKTKNFSESAWIVTNRTNSINGYILKPNSLIKLGKVIFRVKEVVIRMLDKVNLPLIPKSATGNFQDISSPLTIEQYSSNNLIQNCGLYNSRIGIQEASTITNQNINNKKFINLFNCRICLSEDNDQNNPLIYPCKCSGTMKYIHLDCLKHWIKTRITTKEINHLTIQTMPIIVCELCKEKIPHKIKSKNNEYMLIESKRPDSNFIMLELATKEDSEKKIYYMIDFLHLNTLRVGRSAECEVRFADIAISRHHGNFIIKDGNCYYEDMNSKFGSFFLLKNDIQIYLNNPLHLQISKHYVFFHLKQTLCGIFDCCFTKTSTNVDYNKFIEANFDNKEKMELKECETLKEQMLSDKIEEITAKMGNRMDDSKFNNFGRVVSESNNTNFNMNSQTNNQNQNFSHIDDFNSNNLMPPTSKRYILEELNETENQTEKKRVSCKKIKLPNKKQYNSLSKENYQIHVISKEDDQHKVYQTEEALDVRNNRLINDLNSMDNHTVTPSPLGKQLNLFEIIAKYNKPKEEKEFQKSISFCFNENKDFEQLDEPINTRTYSLKVISRTKKLLDPKEKPQTFHLCPRQSFSNAATNFVFGKHNLEEILQKSRSGEENSQNNNHY